MIDLIGELRRIMNKDRLETFDPATDSLEALSLALGGGPSVGLWMFGVCDPAMVASTNTIVTNNLVNMPDEVFADQFWMQVIRNDDAVGTAPEGEIRHILGFTAATQTFTVDPFSANVEANDLICIFHESLLSHQILGHGTLTTSSTTVPADNARTETDNDYFKGCLLMPTEGVCRFQPRPIQSYIAATGVFGLAEPFTSAPGLVDYVVISAAYPVQMLQNIFTLVNAMLVLTETGGTITATGLGTEDNVYINETPAGEYYPRKVVIDLSDLAAAETATIRTYYRIKDGGTKRLKDEVIFAGVQSEPMKNVELEPNRFGIAVTIEASIGVIIDWEAHYEV